MQPLHCFLSAFLAVFMFIQLFFSLLADKHAKKTLVSPLKRKEGKTSGRRTKTTFSCQAIDNKRYLEYIWRVERKLRMLDEESATTTMTMKKNSCFSLKENKWELRKSAVPLSVLRRNEEKINRSGRERKKFCIIKISQRWIIDLVTTKIHWFSFHLKNPKLQRETKQWQTTAISYVMMYIKVNWRDDEEWRRSRKHVKWTQKKENLFVTAVWKFVCNFRWHWLVKWSYT